MLAGARGYVLKNLADESLVEAIRSVARGGSVLDPALSSAVAAGMRKLASGSLKLDSTDTSAAVGPDLRGNKAAPPGGLTDLEAALLRLIAEGRTNREIADQLSFTEKTIRNYVSSLLAKLNLRNRAEAAAYAVSHNLIKHE
jgi:two-component system, NarL family, response regulator DevR